MTRLKAATHIALTFFIIGTILLLLRVFFRGFDILLVLGYYYLLFSVLINSVIVLILLAVLYLEEDKWNTVKSIAVILINIPIAMLYGHLVFNFLI